MAGRIPPGRKLAGCVFAPRILTDHVLPGRKLAGCVLAPCLLAGLYRYRFEYRDGGGGSIRYEYRDGAIMIMIMFGMLQYSSHCSFDDKLKIVECNMEHHGAFVLAPRNHERRHPFPSSWRRDMSQFTGSYVFWKYHFGLKGADWLRIKEDVWAELERPLKERDSELVGELGAVTLGNIEACCRSFYGYLVHVRGMGMRQANDVRHLLDPTLLNAFWVFMATPQSKGGRGSARDTMRLMCNSIMHMLISCRVLKLRGTQDDSPTPRRILKWWKKTAQPLCRRCPIGPRKGKARGDGKLWPRFQVRCAVPFWGVILDRS